MTPGALGFMLAAAPPGPRQCPASAPTCTLSLSQWRPCPPGSLLLAWRLQLHLAQALPELLSQVGYDHTFFNEVQGPLQSWSFGAGSPTSGLRTGTSSQIGSSTEVQNKWNVPESS